MRSETNLKRGGRVTELAVHRRWVTERHLSVSTNQCSSREILTFDCSPYIRYPHMYARWRRINTKQKASIIPALTRSPLLRMSSFIFHSFSFRVAVLLLQAYLGVTEHDSELFISQRHHRDV